jgi:hypothetical protein
LEVAADFCEIVMSFWVRGRSVTGWARKGRLDLRFEFIIGFKV